MVAFLIELAQGVIGIDYDKARDLVRMRNKCGETALHEAVRFDNVKMVQDLLSADKELAEIVAEDGTSPLYLACSLGHVPSVRLILDEGKEPSYSGPRGQNELHAAALQNNKGYKFPLYFQFVMIVIVAKFYQIFEEHGTIILLCQILTQITNYKYWGGSAQTPQSCC